MRKLFTILSCLISASIFGQTFPVTQNLGNSTTLIDVKGALRTVVGFVPATYPDTATANLNPYIKNYAGALIRTVAGDKYWRRNNATTAWVAIEGVSSTVIISTVSIINDTTIRICDNTGACDTIIISGGDVQNVFVVNDSTLLVCNIDNTVCDTVSIPKTFFDRGFFDPNQASFQNTLHTMNGNDLRLIGGTLDINDDGLAINTRSIITPIQAVNDHTDLNTVKVGYIAARRVAGAGAAGLGIGYRVDIDNASSNGVTASNVTTEWSVATAGSETALIKFNVLSAGTLANRFSIEGSTRIRADGIRFEEAMGANVASAGDLTLGVGGNTFTITGTTQINAITTANWQAGSVIHLLYSGVLTVKHNTAGGAGTAPILLAGSTDLITDANTVLTLVYNGTQWEEASRKQSAVGNVITVQEEGTLVATVPTLNFISTGITATYNSPANKVDITLPEAGIGVTAGTINSTTQTIQGTKTISTAGGALGYNPLILTSLNAGATALRIQSTSSNVIWRIAAVGSGGMDMPVGTTNQPGAFAIGFEGLGVAFASIFGLDSVANMFLGANAGATLLPTATATRTITITNGSAPSVSQTDGIRFYSADQTAGNAAPHFRTENGSIIKLYQNSAVTTAQGIADALTNLGLLASSTISGGGGGSVTDFIFTDANGFDGTVTTSTTTPTLSLTTTVANTRVMYSNSGAIAGVSGFTSDGTNVTAGSGNLRATSPRFTTSILDANGLELFVLTATGSAVNELTFANASTGGNPIFTASGDDANVGLDFLMKGTGVIRFTGNATQAAEIRLLEDTDDGTNYVSFKAPTLAANTAYTLPIDDGDADEVLKTNGSGVLEWVAQSGGGGMSIGGTVTSGTAGSVLFIDPAATLAQDNANFFWDNTNNRLGIGGTTTPAYGLTVVQPTGSGINKGFLLSGDEVTATGNGTATRGALLALGVSRPGNVQFWLGSSENFASSTLFFVRFQTSLTYPILDPIRGDGAVSGHITIGSTSGSHKVGIGMDGSTTPANKLTVVGSGSFGANYTTTNAPTDGLLVEGNVVIGTTVADNKLHVEVDAAATNTVTNVFRMSVTSTGTPAAGIGVAGIFEVETAAGNNEIGARIEVVTTDVTSTSEDFDMLFYVMTGGATATEKARITSLGNFLLGGTASAASATNTYHFFNGTAPSASIANGVLVFSEDVAASAELRARDEAGNVVTLSPHNFTWIPNGRSEEMAWSYNSERGDQYIAVDMTLAMRTIEKQSQEIEILKEQVAKLMNLVYQKSDPVKLVYTGSIKDKKPNPKNN